MKKSFLVLSVPFVFLLIMLSFPDLAMMQDLGRHIKMGEVIAQCRCVPTTNLFSYTQTDHLFINHHWLSELLFFNLYHIFSLPSLMMVKLCGILLSFAIIFKLALSKSTHSIATLFAVFYILIFSERFYTRPELISFLLLAGFLYCIERFRTHHSKHIVLILLFLELIWVNAHIYFPIGFGLLVLLLIEQLYIRSKTWKYIGVITLLTALVTLINPSGLTGALYPLHILDHYGYSIVENQNIFFLNTFFFNPRILIFEMVSLVLIIVAIVRIKSHELFWMMASVLATLSAFIMIRNFSIFVLVTLPYISFLVEEAVKGKKFRRSVLNIGAVLAGILILIQVWTRLTLPEKWFNYEPGVEQAVAFVQKNNIHGPIFNNFDIGSYLIFRLYPTERVFVDGRPEAYSVAFFDDYKKMQLDPLFFDQQVKRYGITTIIFSHTDITPWAQQFLVTITKNPDWINVYIDQKIIILVKNTPENKALINATKKSL